MQVNVSKLARAWNLTPPGALKRAKSLGYPVTKSGRNTMVEVPDDSENLFSVDSRFQEARAILTEQKAEAATKQNLATNEKVALAINQAWDEDFNAALPVLKDFLLAFLKKHKATAKERKECADAFKGFKQAIQKNREKRYAEMLKHESASLDAAD